MRIAALAFGILAGLVASFILALGGLDAAELSHLDGRQMQLVTFGLFVIANLGVLGAGLVLAAPLAGAILFVVGALGWLGAALAMHHGPDYVMLTPPAILIVAGALSIAAFIRRRHLGRSEAAFGRSHSLAAQRAAMRDAGDEDEEQDDLTDSSGVSVGASFFGDAGTATPLRGAMPPPPDSRRDTWEPVRRRVEPPRQKPMFRSVEDYDDDDDDEESGISRLARGISSVLSFGLYGALAAAAVLVFWNLRTVEIPRDTATRIDASASVPKAPALAPPPSSAAPTIVAEAPAAPTLSPSPTASVSPQLIAPTPPQLSGTSRLAVPVASADTPNADSAPAQASGPEALTAGGVVAEGPTIGDIPADAASSAAPSSAEPQPADDLAGNGVAGPLMPYPMPPEIAAGRPTAKPRPAAPSAPAPRADTGL